ncbi:conserved hypothetical protein [Frankia canadensis]|uniref:Uncharacterized protein n=1 Tax=Frankia canadensis TaxID=1836972 RepID=A0A2I2KJQ0_9ACTN|nr:hypothetical protein [Frankia canadensis]SNQ45885.1 conserved hypothetical protein [Frankia canadensis]SOU53175.1 conserved hypothetical protein [Frankia canadensis]
MDQPLECPVVTGLPSVAVLGLDAASAAATIALVDGGLPVTAVTPAPVTPAALAALAAYGCADRVVEVAAGTLRLTSAGVTTTSPAAPPFEIHGAPADPPGDEASLGTFDAVVLTDGTRALLPDVADSPRFGGVFDLRTAWVFHLSDAPDLAGAQGRWIGEYLRGRYAPPDPVAMGAASPSARGLPWRGGARAAITELERELRAGHARAASAGYPLPTPPVPPVGPTTPNQTD